MSAGSWAYSSTPVLTSQQQAEVRKAKELEQIRREIEEKR